MSINQRTHRNAYNRLRDGSNPGPLDEPLSPNESSESLSGEEGGTEMSSSPPVAESDRQSPPDSGELPKTEGSMEVVILDTASNRFTVACSPTWTIAQLKSASSQIHHVPPASQRLIYMGKLLQDDKTLNECGITESETILHLFPKPNVVVCDDPDEQEPEMTTGAHIPQIIMDAEEARRASAQILFSSAEMFEAQHRVKLLSFLLLVICSMELLTLVTIMLGVPDTPGMEDDLPPGDPTDNPYNTEQVQMREWRNSDYVDLIISGFGFYVATLGIKATAENTLRSAKKYYVGLIFVGVAWVGYYYYLSVDQTKRAAEEREKEITDKKLYSQALVGIFLPVCVWVICFLRAWQFQRLIMEAERETEVRMGEFAIDQDGENNDLRLVEDGSIV